MGKGLAYRTGATHTTVCFSARCTPIAHVSVTTVSVVVDQENTTLQDSIPTAISGFTITVRQDTTILVDLFILKILHFAFDFLPYGIKKNKTKYISIKWRNS